MFNSISFKCASALVTSLSLMGCVAQTDAAPQDNDTLTKQAEVIIQPWVSQTAPGVSVAVSLNDEVVFARGAGLANLEHSVELAPDSVFLVASVSKQFTAFATLMLVSEGKIDLDDDIRDFIPELNEAPAVITVRHLLDHMGGLRERNTLAAMAGWMEDDIQTEAQLQELVVRQKGVNFAAGEQVEYSNTGYALLAEIVARVSGESFQSFMATRVFEPLEMTDTRFPESRNDIIPNRATSYYPAGDSFKNIISAGEATGSTGLYTTALDLLKWAENFETQTVGDARVFEMMAARAEAANGRPSTFAKGHELRPYNGFETWSHGGRDAGYRSFLLRVPEADFEVSILSNRTDFDTAKMAFALMETYLEDAPEFDDKPPADFEAATLAELSSYAGLYEFYPGVIFDIRATEEGLTFESLGAPRGGLTALPQIGEREFELNADAGLSVIFHAPENGASQELGYKIGLHGTLEAKRVELEPFETTSINPRDYVGVYESEELDAKYKLSVEDGELVAKHLRIPAFALSAYQDDVFRATAGPLQRVEFMRGGDGHVIGFLGSAPLSEGIEFVKLAD